MTQAASTSDPHQVRRWRTALRLTQAALADRLGVTKRAVQHWEAGHRTPHYLVIRYLSTLVNKGDPTCAQPPE